MKKKTIFNITKLDISTAKPSCPKRCPIARSAKRHKFNSVYVGNTYIRLDRKKYKLPQEAIKFIDWYDSYLGTTSYKYQQYVKPFSFSLDIRL